MIAMIPDVTLQAVTKNKTKIKHFVKYLSEYFQNCFCLVWLRSMFVLALKIKLHFMFIDCVEVKIHTTL